MTNIILDALFVAVCSWGLAGAAAATACSQFVGGVCPFAIKEGVTVYLDESLKRFQTVFPACGSSNSAIELTIEELEKYAAPADWVDVCKGWQV